METIATAAYQVPNKNLDALRTKVERLGRRCARLGLPALALITHRADERVRYVSAEDDGYGGWITYTPARKIVLPCTWVELSGALPIVAGYTFVAHIEHTEAGNLVTSPRTDMLGPQADLVQWRTANPICAHCKTDRARKDTYVLRAPDGELVQIGRNCLADYIRSNDAEVAVSILHLTNEIEKMAAQGDDWGEESGGYGWAFQIDKTTFVACAVRSVRENGFRPATFDNSTKHDAGWLAGRAPKDPKDLDVWKARQPTADDRAKADLVLAWVAGTTDPSDYMHNLRIVCALPSAAFKHHGFLASVVSAYDRAMGKVAEARAPKATSEYQGTIKARTSWTLTVLHTHSMDGDYGVTHITIFKDAAGNVYKWNKSGGDALETGKTFEVRGTVKAHTEYKGTKQTVLTRCIVTEHGDEQAANAAMDA